MKLLIGGSPCTHWSIAQTKNRETEASGIGWELFLNYRIARDKYKPDYFFYENNKSMSPAIRTQITAELGVEPVLINSALLSAQNRQRLYWVGKRESDDTYSQVPIEQPEDRGILLRDILETGIAWQEKSYCITATEYKGSNPKQTLSKHRRTMVAEPIIVNGTKSGKARTVDAHMGNLENNLVPRINNPNHWAVYTANTPVGACSQKRANARPSRQAWAWAAAMCLWSRRGRTRRGIAKRTRRRRSKFTRCVTGKSLSATHGIRSSYETDFTSFAS